MSESVKVSDDDHIKELIADEGGGQLNAQEFNEHYLDDMINTLFFRSRR